MGVLFLATACSSSVVASDVVATEGVDSGYDGLTIPLLTMGTNVPGASDSASFEVIEDGYELDIVFGQQGLWMVVLALQVEGVTSEYVDVGGALVVDGATVGSLSLKRQRLKEGEGGLRYLLNFFLVLDEPSQDGRDGIVTMDLTPEGGDVLTLSRQVRLNGGPELDP